MVKTIVVDPDPYGSSLFDCPGFGFVSILGMRIRIQEHENWPKLISKPGFLPFKTAFIPSKVCFLTYYFLLSIFFVINQLFVILESDKVPDPRGSALVWLPGSRFALRSNLVKRFYLKQMKNRVQKYSQMFSLQKFWRTFFVKISWRYSFYLRLYRNGYRTNYIAPDSARSEWNWPPEFGSQLCFKDWKNLKKEIILQFLL